MINFANNGSCSVRWLVALGLVIVQVLNPLVVGAQAAVSSAGEAPAAAMAAGFVSSVTGDVFIRNAKGVQFAAKPGDVIEPGSTFVVGANGQLGLLFADGEVVGLSANSTLRVTASRFDASDIKSGRTAIVLVSGAMTLVTGVIGKESPQAMSITAGNMTIGTLGKEITSFGIQVDATTQLGSAAVTAGEISLRSPEGKTITVGSEQFVRLQSGVATASPQPLSAAPAALQALADTARSFAQPETAASLDVQAAVKLALANLPAPAAGPAQTVSLFLAAPVQIVPVFIPVTPGAAGGCTGSPC